MKRDKTFALDEIDASGSRNAEQKNEQKSIGEVHASHGSERIAKVESATYKNLYAMS